MPRIWSSSIHSLLIKFTSLFCFCCLAESEVGRNDWEMGWFKKNETSVSVSFPAPKEKSDWNHQQPKGKINIIESKPATLGAQLSFYLFPIHPARLISFLQFFPQQQFKNKRRKEWREKKWINLFAGLDLVNYLPSGMAAITHSKSDSWNRCRGFNAAQFLSLISAKVN